jgi:hypothetical protein
VTLRSLDIVHYKCTAVDRKRDLLPIEEDLWNVLYPFLTRLRGFATQLTQDAISLESLDEEGVDSAVRGTQPWSVRVAAVLTDFSPTVGDREHLLFFNQKEGLFTRVFLETGAAGGASDVLVTHPHRLQCGMPIHPHLGQILSFLVSLKTRIGPPLLREALSALAASIPPPAPAPAAEGAALYSSAADLSPAEMVGAAKTGRRGPGTTPSGKLSAAEKRRAGMGESKPSAKRARKCDALPANSLNFQGNFEGIVLKPFRWVATEQGA